MPLTDRLTGDVVPGMQVAGKEVTIVIPPTPPPPIAVQTNGLPAHNTGDPLVAMEL